MAKVNAHARHEAAHAVTAVRLGLPLLGTDIIRRAVALQNRGGAAYTVDGKAGASAGTTEIAPEADRKEKWAAGEIPTPSQIADFEARAAQAAAGIVADGGDIQPIGVRGDVTAIAQFYGTIHGLGHVKIKSTDQDFLEFLERAKKRAHEALMQDGGAAWDRVTVTLARKHSLSGDDVRALVAESDERGT